MHAFSDGSCPHTLREWPSLLAGAFWSNLDEIIEKQKLREVPKEALETDGDRKESADSESLFVSGRWTFFHDESCHVTRKSLRPDFPDSSSYVDLVDPVKEI